MGETMQDRVKKLKRLLLIQTRLKQLQEWRLKQIEHEEEQVARDRQVLVEALDRETFRAESLADMIDRNLDRAARKSRLLESARGREMQLLEKEHKRLKHIERLFDTAARSHRTELSKRELQDVLEQAVRDKKG